MEAEVEALRSQIARLELQIEVARGRAERLRERAGHGLGAERSSLGSEAGGCLGPALRQGHAPCPAMISCAQAALALGCSLAKQASKVALARASRGGARQGSR
jgi:hypothetical protein